MLSVRLLTSKPPAGSMPQVDFDRSETCTWVLFTDDGGAFADWAGAFGNAGTAFYSAAVPFSDGRHALVIAKGQGYVVDVHARALVRSTPWSYSYSAWRVPGRDFVMVADTCELWAVTIDGERMARLSGPWFKLTDLAGNAIPAGEEDFQRIALDGIVFDQVDSQRLSGLAWLIDGWHPFVLDFDRWHVDMSALIDTNHDAYQAQPERGGYPVSEAYHDWMATHWLG